MELGKAKRLGIARIRRQNLGPNSRTCRLKHTHSQAQVSLSWFMNTKEANAPQSIDPECGFGDWDGFRSCPFREGCHAAWKSAGSRAGCFIHLVTWEEHTI